MKKGFTWLLVFALLFQSVVFKVNASTNYNIKLAYESNSLIIITDQYETGVYAVDKDYIDDTNGVIIDASDFDIVFDYEVRLENSLTGEEIVNENGQVTNGQVVLDLPSTLAVGDYSINISLDNGLEQITKTFEIAYYYYHFMDITSTYLDDTVIKTLTSESKEADMITSGLYNVSRAKLLEDNSLKLTLSNFENFDLEKSYSYKIDYQIFESGNLAQETLIEQTSFIPQDTVSITVNNLKTSLELANKNYSLLLRIYDEDTNEIIEEARFEYLLQDFLLDEGRMLNQDKKGLTTIIEPIYKDSAIVYIDEMLASTKYYVQVNGDGLVDNQTYYYQIGYYKEDKLVSSSNIASVKGSALKNGIEITSASLEDITSFKVFVSDVSISADAYPKTFTFNLNYITLDETLNIDKTNQVIIVNHNMTQADMKTKVKVTGMDSSNYEISFTNATTTGFKTNSKMYVKKDGQTLSEYTIIVLGDINADGNISMSDVIKLRKHIAGIDGLNNIETIAANVNQDKSLSMSDVIKLRKHIAGIETL